MANSNEDGGKYEFEDFVQSYPTTLALVGDDNGDIADVEDGLTPSFSVFNEDDGRQSYLYGLGSSISVTTTWLCMYLFGC